MAREDVNVNQNIGKNGATILEDGDVVLTHCNAGSLATVQYGTALAPVRSAIEQGKKISVIADETRPRLQGARLTAYELHYECSKSYSSSEHYYTLFDSQRLCDILLILLFF